MVHLRHKTTGDEIYITDDLPAEQGKVQFTITDEGPKTEAIRTMGTTLTNMAGPNPVKITFTVPTQSPSSAKIMQWMDEFASLQHKQSDVFCLTVGYRQAATGEQITKMFDGMFSAKPEVQIGGGVYFQNFEFVGQPVS